MCVRERVGQKWHMKKLITRPQKNKPSEMNDMKQNEMKKDTQKTKQNAKRNKRNIHIYSQTRTRIFVHQQIKKKPTDTMTQSVIVTVQMEQQKDHKDNTTTYVLKLRKQQSDITLILNDIVTYKCSLTYKYEGRCPGLFSLL